MRWSLPSLRRRLPAAPLAFDPAWRPLLEANVASWSELDHDERRHLEDLTVGFRRRTHWEAARGFELTEAIKVVISAQAGVLLLGLGLDAVATLHTIIVHRSTQTQRGERPVGAGGVRTDTPRRIHGLTGPGLPVAIAWDAVRREARSPQAGRNVVHHELAHHLDGRDGRLDGTPPLPAEQRQHWVQVWSEALEDLRSGRQSPLRAYATTSAAELFAVATEVFLSRPVDLDEAHPDLYDLLRRFYAQDPARRRSAGDGAATGG